jgi:uncharacterized membrane protein YkvA (DUF1232 family)
MKGHVAMDALRRRARGLKQMVLALSLAYRDPRTPLVARLFAAGIVAYAVSPIDLIPDFIPLLGYLDDLILLPVLVALAIRLMPVNVWRDATVLAADRAERPTSAAGRIGAALIVGVGVLLAIVCLLMVRHLVG